MLASLITLTGAYIGASFIFNRYPQLLWKPIKHESELIKKALKERGKKILHISHRGGSFENFENSFEAFNHSVNNCKTDVIETDVCLTKDGQVICFHDTDMKRLCGVDKEVEYEDLKDIKYKNQIETHFSVGGTFSVPEGSPQIQPFLLEDLFKTFPNTHINLELKTKNSILIPKVLSLIAKYKRPHITLDFLFSQQWGSFNHKFSQELIKHDSQQSRFLSLQEFMKFICAYIVGVLPFLKIKGTVFQIPFYTEAYYQSALLENKDPQYPEKQNLKTQIQFLIMRSVVPYLNGMNEHLNKRGILVFYWVLNTENDFERCIKSSPNGIITDSPTLLRNFLKKKNLGFE